VVTSEESPTAVPTRVRPTGGRPWLCWEAAAIETEREYGIRHPEELLSTLAEALGELEQAYLEATHENAEPDRVVDEVNDLGPLLLQLVESTETHPGASEPLPTRSEVER
jgi:hypothetical protein